MFAFAQLCYPGFWLYVCFCVSALKAVESNALYDFTYLANKADSDSGVIYVPKTKRKISNLNLSVISLAMFTGRNLNSNLQCQTFIFSKHIEEPLNQPPPHPSGFLQKLQDFGGLLRNPINLWEALYFLTVSLRCRPRF